MFTNSEYGQRERERQRQRESKRQASEGQLEKERQRATARDKKQKRRISLEEKDENFIAAVRKWETIAAGKVKMSGSEKQKKKANKNTSSKFFASTFDIFSIKRVTRKFHITTTTAKKCTKKSAARAKLLF